MGIFSKVTGAIFGGEKTKTARPAPWGPQQEYLKKGFQEAESIYDAAKGSPAYQGPLYAGLTDMQRRGIYGIDAYAQGQGQQLANMSGNAALQNLQAGAGYGVNAQGILAQAQQNPTQGILSDASQYADNPYVSSMIDAASRDVVRNLEENQLTGLAQDAAATGNTYSSKAGVAEGIMRRGAADRVGDIAAQIRGDAYSQGLTMAQDQYNQGMAQQLAANQQVGGALSQGTAGAGAAQGMAFGNYDAQVRAGGALQQDAQGQMDADFQKWAMQDQRASDLLNRYWSIVGNAIGDGTPNMSTQYNKGALDYMSQIAGAVNSAKGLFGG